MRGPLGFYWVGHVVESGIVKVSFNFFSFLFSLHFHVHFTFIYFSYF